MERIRGTPDSGGRDAVATPPPDLQPQGAKPSDEPGAADDCCPPGDATPEQQARELETLLRITEHVNSGLCLDDLLERVYEDFRDLIPYDRIGFALLSDDLATVRQTWSRTSVALALMPDDIEAPVARTSLRNLLHTDEPRVINDLPAYLREHPESVTTDYLVREGMRASLTCPVRAANRPIGFLFFTSRLPNSYCGAHCRIYRQIARHLGMMIEKARLYQRMEDLNASKGRLLGVVAHDLRNPLNVMKGFISLLRNGTLGRDPDGLAAVCDTLQRSADRMLGLVNQLLDFSAIESGHLDIEPEWVDLGAFLTEFHHEMAVLGRSSEIDLVLSPPAARGALGFFDPRRISQVLGNVVSNAFKYSYPNSEVRLGCHKTNTDEVVLSVKDHGKGIPAEARRRLFTDFGRCGVRPVGSESTTGLGLAICKRIVDAHGGRIVLESEVGCGTEVTIVLPTPPPGAI